MGTLPTTPRPATVTLRSETRTFVAMAHNWRRQAIGQDVQRFGLRLTYPPMTRAEAGPLIGFVAEQRGRAGLFQVAPHTHAEPQGLGSAGALSETENRALWSERLDLAPWDRVEDFDFVGTAIAPDGSNTAQVVLGQAGDPSDWPPLVQDLGSGQLDGITVAAVYVKAAGADRTALSLYNVDKDQHHILTVIWSGAVPSFSTSNGLATGNYGIESVGDDWYRIWIRADLLAGNEEQDQLELRIYPRVGEPNAATGTVLWGAQVADELTATEVPDYLQTWNSAQQQGAGPRIEYRVNYLPFSWDFRGDWWGKGCANEPYLGPELKGYTDPPFGDNLAQAWGTPANNDRYGGCIQKSGVTAASSPSYVLSCYVKQHTATRVGLNIYDQGGPTSYSGFWDFDGNGVPVWSYGGVDAHGSEDMGNGWHRVWVMLETATRGITGNDLAVYLYPHEEDDGTPRAEDATYLFGVQLEPGDRPGGYHERNAEDDPAATWSADGVELYTEGWQPAAGAVLKAGDLIKLDGHTKAYMVTRDVEPDAYGTAVVRIEPALVDSVLPYDKLQTEDVPITCALAADLVEIPIDGAGLYRYVLDLVEAW